MRYKTSQDLAIDDVFPPQKGKCSKCGMNLTGQQQKWCSPKCGRDAFQETMFRRGSSSHIREKVFARDKGICATCGIDTRIITRISRRASELIYRDASKDAGDLPYFDPKTHTFPLSDSINKYYIFTRKLFTKASISIVQNDNYSGWDADHIIEVNEGGEHSMDNLQTLCRHVCHKSKTAQYNANRRKKK